MNRNSINVGKKIKTYRKAKKYTLKNLAEKTGLSIGFLSQQERGMTTIAIDSLFNLANVLDVDIMDFFDAAPKSCDDPVVQQLQQTGAERRARDGTVLSGRSAGPQFSDCAKAVAADALPAVSDVPGTAGGRVKGEGGGPRRAESF